MRDNQNETTPDEPEVEEQPQRSFDELAAAVYPERNPQYAEVMDTGQIEDLIRDVEGRVLHRGFCHGKTRDLVGPNLGQLGFADLREIDLQERPMPNIHAPNAAFGSLEGASIRDGILRDARIDGSMVGVDARGADLRGLDLGPDVDIAGARFDGCVLDEETYQRLRRCSGADTARGLRRPEKKL